jgi:hypothetical protein
MSDNTGTMSWNGRGTLSALALALALGGPASACPETAAAGKTLSTSRTPGVVTLFGTASMASTNTRDDAPKKATYVFESEGKTTVIEITDNAVSRVEFDGKEISLAQVRRRNDRVIIQDASGNTLAEHAIEQWSPRERFLVRSGDPFSARGWVSSTTPGQRGVAVAVMPSRKVMIGIQMAEPDSSLRGHLGLEDGKTAMITGVHQGLPAAAAGIVPYDIIVAIDGKTDASIEAVTTAIQSKNPGDTIAFGVIHKGVRKDVTVTLEKFDEDKMNAAEVDAISAAEDGLPEIVWGRDFGNRLGVTGMDPEQLEALTARAQAWGEKARADAELLADRMRVRAERLADEADRLSDEAGARIEERMARLESALQKLMEEMRTAESAGKPTPPPAPTTPPAETKPKP